MMKKGIFSGGIYEKVIIFLGGMLCRDVVLEVFRGRFLGVFKEKFRRLWARKNDLDGVSEPEIIAWKDIKSKKWVILEERPGDYEQFKLYYFVHDKKLVQEDLTTEAFDCDEILGNCLNEDFFQSDKVQEIIIKNDEYKACFDIEKRFGNFVKMR